MKEWIRYFRGFFFSPKRWCEKHGHAFEQIGGPASPYAVCQTCGAFKREKKSA